ncbi:hypothetical protein [Pirellula sp. SH-Sr6A]|uniref:hypothetical protein n=1 Tax=Pirellula sp. SH-Sr6A TaxID=1632865 RepID=UPI0011BA4FCC|nr:hypothetical protein [Pirellula sp. SH-Sr6A]
MFKFRASILISFLTAMLGSEWTQPSVTLRSQSARQDTTAGPLQCSEEECENLRIKLDAQRQMGHELREG